MKLCGLTLLTVSAAFAQAPVVARPTFEVAAIKVNRSDDRGGRLDPSQSGLSAVNMPLKNCIMWAYDVRPDLIYGPASIESTRYDISAKAANATSLRDLKLMLQTLLEDRFHLVSHRETKTIPVYALVVGKGGTKHVSQASPDSQRQMELKSGPGGERLWVFHNTPMANFAAYLNKPGLDRIVIDMTGLTGGFDFTFSEPARDPDIKPVDYFLGDLFGAASSQLGLNVVPRNAPVEGLVVDKVDSAPTEN